MAKKQKRQRLVIDASVARASGGKDAVHPTAKNCRDFLTAVLQICHCVVMTPPIIKEWKKHQSAFARKWRVQMEGRKKVVRIEPSADASLDRKLARAARGNKLAAMRKDLHLIEAALATDLTVVARDDEARGLFASASGNVRELKDIVWVNPDNAEESPLTWLKNGAKAESRRKLGSPQ